MLHDLQLRGYSDRTIEAYVRAVAQLAKFYSKFPDRITEEEVCDYLLHLTNVQKVARGTHTIALCGIKFFYEQTLQRHWRVLDVARPKGEKKLPVVLSRDEVWRILHRLHTPVYRTCLTVIYACGLRLMEGARLQVPDGRRPETPAPSRQGRQGPLCAAPGCHAAVAARVLALASQSALAFPDGNEKRRGAAQ